MRVRVSTVQFGQQPLMRFEQFAERVSCDVSIAREFGSQLVCFPEYLTGSLLTIPGSPSGHPEAWDFWTSEYIDLFSALARQSGVYILGGTHLVLDGGRLYNTAHLFDPRGKCMTQRKIHLTPCEVSHWSLGTGDAIRVFDTEIGKIAMLICFDIEFPEAVRAAALAGADTILCPSCTDDRQGFWRVRYCCHARTVENQVYVVHSALTGNLPGVRHLEQTYGRSGILSPCDTGFAKDGIVADGELNQHLVVTGDIDLCLLAGVRRAGSVTPLLSRRDCYQTEVYPMDC